MYRSRHLAALRPGILSAISFQLSSNCSTSSSSSRSSSGAHGPYASHPRAAPTFLMPGRSTFSYRCMHCALLRPGTSAAHSPPARLRFATSTQLLPNCFTASSSKASSSFVHRRPGFGGFTLDLRLTRAPRSHVLEMTSLPSTTAVSCTVFALLRHLPYGSRRAAAPTGLSLRLALDVLEWKLLERGSRAAAPLSGEV